MPITALNTYLKLAETSDELAALAIYYQQKQEALSSQFPRAQSEIVQALSAIQSAEHSPEKNWFSRAQTHLQKALQTLKLAAPLDHPLIAQTTADIGAALATPEATMLAALQTPEAVQFFNLLAATEQDAAYG